MIMVTFFFQFKYDIISLFAKLFKLFFVGILGYAVIEMCLLSIRDWEIAPKVFKTNDRKELQTMPA